MAKRLYEVCSIMLCYICGVVFLRPYGRHETPSQFLLKSASSHAGYDSQSVSVVTLKMQHRSTKQPRSIAHRRSLEVARGVDSTIRVVVLIEGALEGLGVRLLPPDTIITRVEEVVLRALLPLLLAP